MRLIDWFIFAIPILVVLGSSVYAQRFFKNTADFLVASRTGGRYLLTATNGIAGIGVITFVAGLESFYQAGWTLAWWNNIGMPVGLLLAATGFVFYRYRQTRVMTMAQFFEVRYSRKFRIAMGFICFVSGLLNFGIFPAITTQFFMIFLDIPTKIGIFPTYPCLMFLLLSTAACITISGGQVQNMVTDTVQALFGYVFCVVISFAVIFLFSMSDLREALVNNGRSYSMVNPFDTASLTDFNIYFVLIAVFCWAYSTGAFQGSQGYAGSALNPHESKMGGILNTWRQVSLWIFTTIMALAALTYLYKNPNLEMVNAFGEVTQNPRDGMIHALSNIMPIGIKGMFAALMFFFMLSTDTTYLHSWGVIFVQDVILPLHGKKVSQKQHLLLLRLSILFVAIFGFTFSIFYMQNEYILMFQMATGAFFSAAGGSAIIGGLYWARGTTRGAWVALFAGVMVSGLSILVMDKRGWVLTRDFLITIFGEHPYLLSSAERCPINGAYFSLFAVVSAILCYVLVSISGKKESFNMDKLLHRKAYAIIDDQAPIEAKEERIPYWKQLFLGFDHEFSKGDKLIATLVFIWVSFWFSSFVVITAWNLIALLIPNQWIVMWSSNDWFNWMMFQVFINLILAPITAVWLAWGGFRDMLKMFKILKHKKHDNDDGFVSEQ